MAFVKLCTVEDVTQRFSLPTGNTDLEETITSSFSAVAEYLQEHLSTPLDKADNTIDYFHIDAKKWCDSPPGKMVRLFLNRAFVKAIPAPVIKVSTSYDIVKAGIESEVVPEADYHIDRERGIVYLKDSYHDYYGAVTYSSGFEEEGDESIPNWLKEAAISYVPVVLDQNSTNRTPQEAALAKSAGAHASTVMQPHLRRAIAFPLKAMY